MRALTHVAAVDQRLAGAVATVLVVFDLAEAILVVVVGLQQRVAGEAIAGFRLHDDAGAGGTRGLAGADVVVIVHLPLQDVFVGERAAHEGRLPAAIGDALGPVRARRDQPLLVGTRLARPRQQLRVLERRRRGNDDTGLVVGVGRLALDELDVEGPLADGLAAARQRHLAGHGQGLVAEQHLLRFLDDGATGIGARLRASPRARRQRQARRQERYQEQSCLHDEVPLPCLRSGAGGRGGRARRRPSPEPGRWP